MRLANDAALQMSKGHQHLAAGCVHALRLT